MQTSEGAKYRLLFTVRYKVGDSEEEIEEHVYSTPFIVYSNKGNRKHGKKRGKRRKRRKTQYI